MSAKAGVKDVSAGERPREVLLVRHLIWRGLGAVALIAILIWGAVVLTRKDHAPAPREAQQPADPMPVGVVHIEPREVPLTAQFLAQTEPSEIVPIRARVSGFLVERSFEEGEVVQAGQVLFRIDPQPFEVALRQAEAGLKAAEAQLVRAEQQVRRFQNLAELQQAAANELEQAQEAQRIAAAAVETNRARIEEAKLNLDYATIKSPITGVIGMRQQDVGSYVGAGADTLLATVRKVDPLYVRYSVSERDLLRWQRMTEEGLVTDVPVDQLTVTIVLPDGRVFPHKGHINYVDVAIDPSTGTALVRSTVPNPDRTLRPGQFVHAVVSGVTRIGAIVVPQSAVTQTPNGAAVYVVDRDSKAQIRPVTLGDWVDRDWLIESGLQPGDIVIVDHLMQVRPGMLVKPQLVTHEEATTLPPADAEHAEPTDADSPTHPTER